MLTYDHLKPQPTQWPLAAILVQLALLNGLIARQKWSAAYTAADVLDTMLHDSDLQKP